MINPLQLRHVSRHRTHIISFLSGVAWEHAQQQHRNTTPQMELFKHGQKKLPWLSMESSRSEVEDSCRQGPISSREEPEELCCCIHADSQLLLAVSWRQLTVSTRSHTSRDSLFEVILSLFVGNMKMIQTGVFFSRMDDIDFFHSVSHQDHQILFTCILL